jgi:hypothetical protein
VEFEFNAVTAAAATWVSVQPVITDIVGVTPFTLINPVQFLMAVPVMVTVYIAGWLAVPSCIRRNAELKPVGKAPPLLSSLLQAVKVAASARVMTSARIDKTLFFMGILLKFDINRSYTSAYCIKYDIAIVSILSIIVSFLI